VSDPFWTIEILSPLVLRKPRRPPAGVFSFLESGGAHRSVHAIHSRQARSLPIYLSHPAPADPRSIRNDPPRLARNTIIESTFDVGRRYQCTMRINCGQLDPDAVIQPIRGEWHPRMPERLDEEELANWRAGRDAVYQLARLRSVRASRSPTDKPSIFSRTRYVRRFVHINIS
jgi:hypothetical protein